MRTSEFHPSYLSTLLELVKTPKPGQIRFTVFTEEKQALEMKKYFQEFQKAYCKEHTPKDVFTPLVQYSLRFEVSFYRGQYWLGVGFLKRKNPLRLRTTKETGLTDHLCGIYNMPPLQFTQKKFWPCVLAHKESMHVDSWANE